MKTNPAIPVGSIVALKPYPSGLFVEFNRISIGGDPLHVCPLMVVVEVFKERNAKYEEISGLNLADTNSCQCKCIWFSSKSHQFEETRISSKHLDVIQSSTAENQNGVDPKLIIDIGKIVTLKTTPLEIQKQKCSRDPQIYDSHLERKLKYTSLLSFVCPPLVVVGTSKNEIKEHVLDANTGEQIRWLSNKLVKCKYFNAHSEKYSEVLVPIEALISIPTIENIGFQNVTKGRTVLANFDTSLKGHSRTVIRFGETIYVGGFYKVEVFDEINLISSEISLENIDEYYSDFVNNAPVHSKYSQISSGIGKAKKVFLSYGPIPKVKEILKRQGNNIFYRIKYVGLNSRETSIRFISNCKVMVTTDKKTVIAAFCHKKKAERFFFWDQIEEIQVFDLNDLPTKTKRKPIKKP
jgi:hypothetical protein